jgi:hypothetical protein
VNRIVAWLAYQRILSRFVALYESSGYDVSPPVYRQLQQCAREEVLRQALSQAAGSVEPDAGGLDQIRARIAHRELRR